MNFTNVLIVVDVVLTAALTLLVHFKPNWKGTPVVQAVEDEVKALEDKPKTDVTK